MNIPVWDSKIIFKKHRADKMKFDLHDQLLGEAIRSRLEIFGFGVLSKSDLEVVLYDAMLQASPALRAMNSYYRAEALRISDTRYRVLERRRLIWLGETDKVDEQALLSEILTMLLWEYSKLSQDGDVRLLVDDEGKRRAIQKTLERLQIAAEISLTGRFLIMRQKDLSRLVDELIARVDQSSPHLQKILEDYRSQGRTEMLKAGIKAMGEKLLGEALSSIVGTMIK